MAQLGHYGTPGLIAGITAIVLLVLHLAVPFGFVDYGKEMNDGGIDDETVSRGDISDGFNGPVEYGMASVGLTLTGIILAMIAGILLFVIGMLPIPVVAARFAGWTLGLLGALGAFMSLSSSAYWLGTGFSTLLAAIAAAIQDTPNTAGRLWIISPVIIFAGAFTAFLSFIKVMNNVIAKRDDLRDRANHILRGSVLAAIILTVMLVVPWSVLILDGEDRRLTEPSACSPSESCQSATYFYTAFGHSGDSTATQGLGAGFGGILGIAEVTKDSGDLALFQGLAFSIKVLTAMAWIGVLLGMLTTFGHLISSAFNAPGAARFAPTLLMLNVPMLLWGAIMFVLANAYMWQPSFDELAFYGGMQVSEQSWWYAFAPLAVAVPIAMWAFNQYTSVRSVFGEFGGSIPVAKEEANFD